MSPPLSNAPAAPARVNILLVDDREDKLLILRVMLEELGENLIVARSGKDALRELLKEEFAVILLDVNMPIMDGFETAALIRQRPRSETTPIIFFSAVNDADTHVSRGYSLGAVDYILTPVVPEILRAKVAVFVDLFRKTEQVKRQADERAELFREQAARREAERANEAKDRFLAMLSHELRTPLTPVVTTILSLESLDDLSEPVRSGLAMIRRNVELEARLIDDLLDLTRISKGKVQLHLDTVDAHALLQSAMEICGPDIAAKKLVVQVKLEAAECHVRADPARLQQVFWNLIKNAVKFTGEAGRLIIETGSHDGNLCVSVADTGIGIAPELLPKMFDAFEQGAMARRGGLGLGLAITKALVELHHGRILAESEGLDRGAKFTVWFPLTEAVAGGARRPAASPAPDRRERRILLVEDHEDSNRSLTLFLRRRGYEVRPACDMRSALEVAADFDFDVLVSDMGLPDGTGNDVIRKLAESRPVYGIALTGFGMESDIEQSQAAGFRHHLVKPVDLTRLDHILQSAGEAETGAGDGA